MGEKSSLNIINTGKKQIQRRKVTIEGYSVTYYMQGDGKTVLFLHGGRVSALTFKKFISLLATKYRVIAPDIPGFGKSDTPKEVWSFIDYGKFFDKFLESLLLENVIVIGYSMGGGIAINLAAQSKRVNQLILIDSSGIKVSRKKDREKDIGRVKFYLTHPQYLPTFISLLLAYVSFSLKHILSPRHILSIRDKCFDTDYGDEIKRVTTPTTIIWGRYDQIYPVDIGYRLKNRIPQSSISLVPGNHDWLAYNPLLYKHFLPHGRT